MWTQDPCATLHALPLAQPHCINARLPATSHWLGVERVRDYLPFFTQCLCVCVWWLLCFNIVAKLYSHMYSYMHALGCTGGDTIPKTRLRWFKLCLHAGQSTTQRQAPRAAKITGQATDESGLVRDQLSLDMSPQKKKKKLLCTSLNWISWTFQGRKSADHAESLHILFGF